MSEEKNERRQPHEKTFRPLFSKPGSTEQPEQEKWPTLNYSTVDIPSISEQEKAQQTTSAPVAAETTALPEPFAFITTQSARARVGATLPETLLAPEEGIREEREELVWGAGSPSVVEEEEVETKESAPLQEEEPQLSWHAGPATIEEERVEEVTTIEGVPETSAVPEPESALVSLLEAIAFGTLQSERARADLAVDISELDKIDIDSIEKASHDSMQILLSMISMGAERQPISHPEEQPAIKTLEEQRAELAAKFIYKDVSEIPTGVDPKQLDFLHDAAAIGAFEWVREYTAEMIADYFTLNIKYIDIAKKYHITKQAVQKRVTRGMSKMRRVLYRNRPDLAKVDAYPDEQIKKGKDEREIFQTEEYKEKRSQTSKNSIRRPGVETGKKREIDIY